MMIDNLADFGSILDAPVQEQTVAKFQPKLQAKLGKAASKAPGTNPNVAEAAAKEGASTVDAVSQDRRDDNHEKGRNDNPFQETRDQESMTISDTQALSVSGNQEDADAIVGLDSLDELISPSTDGAPQKKYGKLEQVWAGARVHVLGHDVAAVHEAARQCKGSEHSEP